MLSVARRLATSALVLNVVLVVTGAAVRLTGSGLGCPTWPRCTAESLTNTPALGIHGYIEFGNRLLGVLLEVVALALLLVLVRVRPRVPRSWIALALVLALVVPAQAVIGGLLVLTRLNPYVLICHFLVSFPLILAAVALRHRLHDGPGRRVPLVGREIRWLTGALVVTAAALLVAGALVTGTGPHAGDVGIARLPFDPVTVTQVHADLGFLMLGLATATFIGALAVRAPSTLRRKLAAVVGLVLAQGLLGYVQYYTGLPALLVLLHVLGAALIFTTTSSAHVATSATIRNSDASANRAAPTTPKDPWGNSRVCSSAAERELTDL